jgi:hypothetical protein
VSAISAFRTYANSANLAQLLSWRRVQPLLVGSTVLLVYLVWFAIWLHAGHDARDFVYVGQVFYDRGGQASSAIHNGPVAPTSHMGFDGQFSYYIAMDPRRAGPYIDMPSYRYHRIAYPMAARLLALGRPSLIPSALVLVNLLALAAGTAALAAWLARRQVMPWTAVLWAFLPGQVFAIEKDLTEVSGYGVAVVALWLRDRWPLLAGAVFGLAGLFRETILIFPAVLFMAEVIRLRRVRQLWTWVPAVAAGAFAALPFLVWKLFLWHFLGRGDVPFGDDFTLIPFGGLLSVHIAELVPLILIPALLCLAAAGWALWRCYWKVEVALLLVNLALLVVFANYSIYVWWINAARASLGAWLAAFLLMAVLPEKHWFWLAMGIPLWLGVLILMRPM